MKHLFKNRLIIHTLYFRMFVLFVILMIPLQAFGIAIMYKGIKTLDKTSQETVLSNVTATATFLDNQMSNIELQLEQILLVSDSNLRKFYVYFNQYNDMDYWANCLDAVNELKYYANCSSLISELVCYYPTLQLSLSSSGGVKNLTEEEVETVVMDTNVKSRSWLNDENNFCIYRTYPVLYQNRQTDNQMPLLILQATISKFELRNYLSICNTTERYPMEIFHRDTSAVVVSTGQIKLSEDYYIAQSFSEYSNYGVRLYVPSEIVHFESHIFYIFMILYVLISIPILLIYAITTGRLVRKPINNLIHACDQIQQQQFSITLDETGNTVEFQRLNRHFTAMANQLDQLITQKYQRELYTKQIELKQLQTQINPHFLYNSFFTLKHLIQDGDESLSIMLCNYLGDYFQYLTRNARSAVPFLDEYMHAISYIRIQQIRFSESLTLEIEDCPDIIRSITVPRLILQPILENAILHGTSNLKEENGYISLCFAQQDEKMHILVANNGPLMTAEQLDEFNTRLQDKSYTGETTGLINIHRRLQLFFEDDTVGIKISQSNATGYLIDIVIPLHAEKITHD